MQRNSQVEEEDVIKIENLLLAIRIPSGFKSVDFVQKMELKFVDFDNLKERETLSKLFFGVSSKKKRLLSLQYKMCFKVSRTKMA
jgi:hypothetical protein